MACPTGLSKGLPRAPADRASATATFTTAFTRCITTTSASAATRSLAGFRSPAISFLKVCATVVVLFNLLTGCVCDDTRDVIRRQEVVVGGNVTLTCHTQLTHADPSKLKKYRWVYIRAGTKRPQVLSSGSRLVVGEDRIMVTAKPVDGRVAIELLLTNVRPYESGLFMCWRQGRKPYPQVLLTVLEPGTTPEKQVIRYSEGPSEVKYGNSATFFCVITPSWPVKVTWFKNGEAISPSDRHYSQSVEKTSDSVSDRRIQEEKLVATLTVTSVRKDSVFTCRIESNPPDQRDMPVKVLVPRIESLTSDPDKDVVEYGQPLAISCVVSGTDSEIIWLKDGAKLLYSPKLPGREIYASSEGDHKFGSTVYIDSLTFWDNGLYACYIPGASKTVLINIEGRAPRLLGVTGGDFFEEDTLSLRCTAQYLRHLQPGTFRWQFEGSNLDLIHYRTREYQTDYNVTVHELTIPSATAENAGNYKCLTPYGTASITINMFVPPSLGEPLPSEVRVREGDTVQLACRAVGSPPPAITWERAVGDNWVPVDRTGGINVGPNGELLIPAASIGDAGSYRCVAQSEAGSFLADVVVTVVQTGPEVFDIIAPQNVVVGDNFTVQCTVLNWDGEVDFTFHESSLNALDSSRYQVNSYPMEQGMTQVYLTIKDATLEDAGRYSCKAGAYASSSTVVEVHDRPAEILDFFSSPSVIGRDFFLTCVILNGPPKAAFFKDSLPLTDHEGGRYSIQSASSSPEERTHILKVMSARLEDEGIYECAASAVTSASVNVHPQEAKDVVVSIEATPAIKGRDFNVTCTVKEWDDEVTFIHNNVVINSNKDWRYEVQRFPSRLGSEFTVQTLTVTGATEEDEGTYECYTTPQTFRSTEVTIWDLAEVRLELQVKDRPNWRDSPIPINCIVEGVDPNAVTVVFSHSGEPQISIQNTTEMSKSDHLVNIVIEDSETPLLASPSTTFTLGFYSLSSDFAGIWSCQVALPGGHVLGRDTLLLEIEEPPVFVERIPEEVYVDSDQDLMLNCSTKGSPEIVVSWHSAGIPEPIERRRQSATLFIPGFTAMDVGDYYCSATYLDREIRAKTKLLLRTPKPQVESVSSSPVTEGEDVVVNCIVTHWTGQVLFLHNSESVDPVLTPRYAVRQRPQVRRGPNSVTHTLLIKDSTVNDNGIVECFISLEEYGSTNITVIGEDDKSTPILPTITPGLIVELIGHSQFPEGGTLSLTCVVNPTAEDEVILIRGVFLLYVGDLQIMQDPRMSIDSQVGPDGTRVINLTINKLTVEDGGHYQCTSSTDPSITSGKEIAIVPAGEPFVSPGGDVLDCSIYTSCGECVTTLLPCRWCLAEHRCVQDVDEECRSEDIVFGQDDGYTQSRSGQNYCPVILKDSPEIIVHSGESRAVYLDSKNIEEEKTFDSAKFKCSFVIDGEEILVKARLWYSYVYCDEATFEMSSPKPNVTVPLEVLWGNYNAIDNPDNVHVTVYNCNLMAKTCSQCQKLNDDYKCGWCQSTGACEFEGRCPSGDWIRPDASCSAESTTGGEFTFYGPEEMEIFVHPSEKAELPCTAAVDFDLQAGYWNREYNIKWLRDIDGVVEKISENGFVDVSTYDRPRYALVRDSDSGKDSRTEYSLIIDPVQPKDFGIYRCILTNAKNETVVKAVVLSRKDETISYDRCLLPDHWRGTWYATYDDLTIDRNNFGNALCTASLGSKYLLRNEEHQCNTCFVIHERHPNLLEYRESPCSAEDDLNTLCSLVDDYNLTHLKRKNGVTQCPFPSRRVFTYSTPDESCRDMSSTIISGKNNTELAFWYQPCSGSDDTYYSRKVECVATWRDGSLSYLMGKLEKLPNRPERYRCFTYEEVHGQPHRFEMSETGSEACGEIGVSFEKSYRVFEASRAPEQPTIEGFGSTIRVTEGYSLQLKCSSIGGFPLATLRWMREGREVLSAKEQLEDRSEAVLNIEVGPLDDGARFTCEATNTATTSPLSVSTVLMFSADECQMPPEWIGRWYELNNDRYVDVTLSGFSNNRCSASLGQNYLLHDKRKNCYRCVVINERHRNILSYKRSKCRVEDNLDELCSSLGKESYSLIRVGGTSRCPWVGARSFTYETEIGQCNNVPSRMYSFENDTHMMMLYNPCVDQGEDPDLTPHSERISCVADWSGEDGLRYFMAHLVNPYDYNQEDFRCFTYVRDEAGRQLFRASRQQTGLCSDAVGGADAEYLYKLYGLSEAPSAPIIEGYSPTDQIVVGDVLRLTCVTHGGFPAPRIEWYRNRELLQSETETIGVGEKYGQIHQLGEEALGAGERHEARLEVTTTASDEGARFQCRVSNYVTEPELTATFTLSLSGDGLLPMFKEPKESSLTVLPSDRAVLNCTASLSMNIEQYWDLPYKMRWVYYGEDEPRSLSDMHILEAGDTRISLDIENMEEEDATRYNLVIDPVRVSDEGIYECLMWDETLSISRRVQLTVGGSPTYEDCEFPAHWKGNWTDDEDEYNIRTSAIGEKLCKKSLGNRYLLRNELHDCNECFIIEEKHPNLLRFKESRCTREEDLAILCSMIDYGWRWMMKLNASSPCPFQGHPRPFIRAGEDYRECEENPNKLSLNEDGTELILEDRDCSRTSARAQDERIECLATWTEDSDDYLLGKWRSSSSDIDGGEFRCFTYTEVTDETQSHSFDLSHSESKTCSPANKDPRRAYEIYGESVEPGNPTIQGYDPTERKEVGDAISLTCMSEGGFPPPVLRWFRGSKELRTEIARDGRTSSVVLEVVLEEADVDYKCEVSNMATEESPIIATVTISSLRGIVKTMKPQVMAVEGQNVFLPCGRILEPNLKLEWFDADLDVQLTSGKKVLGANDSLRDEPSYYPYIKDDLFGLMIKSGFLDTKYGCVVDNQRVGNTTLIILPAFYVNWEEYNISDYFEETNTLVEASQNNPASLNCTLRPGIKPVTVSWRLLPSSYLLTQDDLSLSEEKGYATEVVGQSYILHVPRANTTHDGEYVCQVILDDREVYMNNFTLSVQDLIIGNLSSETRLPCFTPTGDTVRFLYEGDVLSPETTVTAKYEWEFEEMAEKGGNLTTLIVKDTSQDDAGVYTCVKADEPQEILRKILLGFASKETLNVTNLRVTDVHGPEFTLAWDRPDGDPFSNIEEYEVLCFERGPENDSFSVTTGNETFHFLFLDEETEYGFQVRVKTDVGWGPFSETLYHTTGKLEVEVTSSTPMTVTTTEAFTSPASTLDPDEIPEEEFFEIEELDIFDEEEEEESGHPEEEDKVPVEEVVEEDDYYDFEFYDYEEEEEEYEGPEVIYDEKVLPCLEFTEVEDLTWKRGEELLFLGNLDLAGIAGLSISKKGELVLAEGPHRDIRDNDTYTCYYFNVSSFDDVEAITYHVFLDGEEMEVRTLLPSRVDVSSEAPDLQFGQVEEIAVLANSDRVGNKVVEVLQSGKLKVRLLDTSCNATDVRSWSSAESAIKECEAKARLSGELSDEEGIFIGIDFFVELTSSSWFAVTQLYLHNMKKDISTSVYTPMIPIPPQSVIQPTEPSETILIQVTDEWWNSVQGVDKSGGSGLTASILSLQETYLNLIESKTS